MKHTIVYTDTSFFINGLEFPLKVGLQLAKDCRLAARLKREGTGDASSEQAWLEWCRQHQWSPEESPALLIEADQSVQELYQNYIDTYQNKVEHKRHWSQLLSDSQFMKIYHAGLSAEALEGMARDIEQNIPMTSRQLYEDMSNSMALSDASAAATILKFGKLLSAHGILLEWPPPPFNAEFYHALSEGFEFQLRWQQQVLLEYSRLSTAARDDLDAPKWPMTPEGLAEWLHELSRVKVRHGTLRFGSGLTDFELRKQKLIEQWMVIWQNTQRDMPALLSLIQSTSHQRTAEEQIAFLYHALIRHPAEGQSLMARVNSHEAELKAEKVEIAAYESEKETHHKRLMQSLRDAAIYFVGIPVIVFNVLRERAFDWNNIELSDLLILPLLYICYSFYAIGGLKNVKDNILHRVHWWLKRRGR